jgi:hypothetical protein
MIWSISSKSSSLNVSPHSGHLPFCDERWQRKIGLFRFLRQLSVPLEYYRAWGRERRLRLRLINPPDEPPKRQWRNLNRGRGKLPNLFALFGIAIVSVFCLEIGLRALNIPKTGIAPEGHKAKVWL